MSLLSRLFGGADPTDAWPAADGPSPQICFERSALETIGSSLHFGDGLDAARFLGRPDVCLRHADGNYSLTYRRWGLHIEFEAHRFVQATFVITPDIEVDGTPLAAAEVRGPDGRALGSHTAKAELLERYGAPSEVQEFDDETILYFGHAPLTSEFQLTGKGRLARWDVYLD